MHRAKGSGLVPWPQRLTTAPPRLEEIGVTPEEFQEDTVVISTYQKALLHADPIIISFCLSSICNALYNLLISFTQ